MTVNANGDAVTCCILQDRRTAVLGNVEKSSLREIWNGPAYRRFRQELAEIMARRGEVSDFGHACAVEGVCAMKGACPTRSHYWAGDLNFRRRFHEMVEEMELPRGEPFEGLSDGRPGMRLPVYK
jgi:radical SAM protein with 4Fe4S-binding SPASM domain